MIQCRALYLFAIPVFCFLFGYPSILFSQSIQVPVGKDGIPIFQLPDIIITSPFASPRHKRKYEKWLTERYLLKARIIKLYPMAKSFGQYFKYIRETAPLLPSEASQKLYKELLEKELFARYEPLILDMSIAEGAVLIKLLHRELGQTAYMGIKEMKSGFSAFFWQQIALVLGNNLKVAYDPEKDKEMEEILIELGADPK